MSFARWAVALAICGCGRIGFDARTTADARPSDVALNDTAGAAIAVVQTAVLQTTTSTTLTITLSATAPGHLIVALAGTPPGHSILSVTDDAPGGTNVYISAGAFSSDVNSGESDYWYAANPKGGVTAITLTADTGDLAALIYEVSGVAATAPLDQAAQRSNQGATLIPTGASITTTVPGEIILTNADVENAITDLRPNGFTSDMPAMFTDGAAHFVAPTPGTYMAVWDQDVAGSYATSSVTFKPAP